MIALIRSLSAPLFSLVILMMASGFFGTFVAIRMQIEGFSNEMIGVVTSALYLGVLIGSIKIDHLISKLGHIRAFIIFALVLSLMAILQLFWIEAWYWSTLRFLGGICMAGIYIAIESWLLMKSSPATRGQILSIYLGIFYAALSSGQLLITFIDPTTIYPFIIAAFLLFISILPICMQKSIEPKIEKEKTSPLSLLQLFIISPVGFIGGIISGMLLAAIYGLVPVYATEVGMSYTHIGPLMAVIIFGGFSLQWPVGRIADKKGPHWVIVIASFLSACCALGMALTSNLYLIYFFAWFLGGFSFTLYPLCMAYACQKVHEYQIVAATGGFVLSYALGAVLGPLIAPFFMNLFGPQGLFYFLSLITLFLGLLGIIHRK